MDRSRSKEELLLHDFRRHSPYSPSHSHSHSPSNPLSPSSSPSSCASTPRSSSFLPASSSNSSLYHSLSDSFEAIGGSVSWRGPIFWATSLALSLSLLFAVSLQSLCYPSLQGGGIGDIDIGDSATVGVTGSLKHWSLCTAAVTLQSRLPQMRIGSVFEKKPGGGGTYWDEADRGGVGVDITPVADSQAGTQARTQADTQADTQAGTQAGRQAADRQAGKQAAARSETGTASDAEREDVAAPSEQDTQEWESQRSEAQGGSESEAEKSLGRETSQGEDLAALSQGEAQGGGGAKGDQGGGAREVSGMSQQSEAQGSTSEAGSSLGRETSQGGASNQEVSATSLKSRQTEAQGSESHSEGSLGRETSQGGASTQEVSETSLKSRQTEAQGSESHSEGSLGRETSQGGGGAREVSEMSLKPQVMAVNRRNNEDAVKSIRALELKWETSLAALKRLAAPSQEPKESEGAQERKEAKEGKGKGGQREAQEEEGGEEGEQGTENRHRSQWGWAEKRSEKRGGGGWQKPVSGTGAKQKQRTSSPQWLPPLPPPPTPPPPRREALEEDKELFARSLKVGAGPPRGKPKIAFMFLAYGPLPLAPLWEKFFKGHEDRLSIYIHTAEGYRYGQDELPPLFRGRQIPSKNASWGDITLVDAERRLLAQAYLDPANQRFVLLSESCIPVHSFETVYQYLMLSNHSYVEVKRELSDNRCWTRKFLPVVKYYDWHKGSQWFELSRELVPLVLQDTNFYVKFGWTYMRWAYADEHYLPTMLRLKAAPKLANRTLTWVKWPKVRRGQPMPHPLSFNSSQISPKLLKSIRWGWRCRNSPIWGAPCHLFARKFKAEALPTLLKLSWYFGY